MFRDLTRYDAVLDVPAAEVFGRGVAKSTERDFKKMFETFEMLGIHMEPESSTTTSTSSSISSSSNDHDHSNHNHDYASAVHQLRFRTNGETQMPGELKIIVLTIQPSIYLYTLNLTLYELLSWTLSFPSFSSSFLSFFN